MSRESAKVARVVMRFLSCWRVCILYNGVCIRKNGGISTFIHRLHNVSNRVCMHNECIDGRENAGDPQGTLRTYDDKPLLVARNKNNVWTLSYESESKTDARLPSAYRWPICVFDF